MKNKFRVSTSEVSTFLTCKQRWMYAHHPSYNLEPRTLGTALTRGIVGHAALENYYRTWMETQDHVKSREAAQQYLFKKSLETMQLGDVEKAAVYSQLGSVLNEYYEDAKPLLDKYAVIGVESLITAPLPGCDDIEFAGRVDVALQDSRDEVFPYDHKFTYNFWGETPVLMNPQINNYVWAFREKGYHSRTGIINMLRYRDNAQDRFKQVEVKTNSTLRDVFIKNHVIAAKQIVELKQKPKVDIEDGITRSSSKFNCEYCPFATLCYTEASGLDSRLMVKASFRPNSYGYDSELDVA